MRVIAWLLLLSTAALARPGAVQVFVFDGAQSRPLADATVQAGGVSVRTDGLGAARLVPPAGVHALVVNGLSVAEVPVSEEVLTEVLVTLRADGRAITDVETRALPPEAVVEAAVVAAGPPAELRGTTLAESDGQPIRGVRVFVRGAAESATTDASGRFSMMLPTGTHRISLIHADYSPGAADVVLPAEGATIEVRLAPAAIALADLEVIAPYIEGGVVALDAERQGQSAVVDVIGAEQMAKSGDGDAASALRRVTGLTVVGGKYVYVRGMGERYSTTLLDGVTLPSPEPERRVVPLDLFPTGLLGSVLVQKTYSPDLPGEFGGGVVQLRTRKPPEEPFFEVALSLDYRPDTTGQDGLTYEGGALDFLGFDDGARALPAGVRRASEDQVLLERTRLSNKGFTAAELDALGESMPNRWNTSTMVVPPGAGVDVAGGGRFELGSATFGAVASLAWSQDWQRRDFERAYYLVGQGGALERAHTYRFSSLERTVGLTGALGLTAALGPDHELASTTLLLRLSDDETRVFEGRNRDAGTEIRVSRLRFVERMLISEILRGTHDFEPIDISWHAAFSLADRQEPDRRTYRYDREQATDQWFLSDRPEGNQRLYSDLDDTNYDLAAAVRWSPDPREAGSEPERFLKLGGQTIYRDRGVDTRRYKFQTKGPRAGDPDLISQTPEEIFVPENIGSDAFQFQETTRQTDNYTADQRLYAGFLMGESPFLGLRFMAGLRVEAFQQRVTTFELFNPDQAPVEARLDDVDLLPAAGVTWPFTETMQLRAAYGRTVTRPDFREMSAATFNDVTGGREIFGNPDLDRGTIQHGDLRWEWYPAPGKSVSVAAFYKAFDRPIEQIIIPSAQFSVTFANAEAADNVGLELEGRWPLLADLVVAGNLALIRSQVTLAEGGIQTSSERPLQGQSPYVLNLQLGWEPEDGGFEATLLYNVFGARIVEVGAQGAPDVLEQPRHQLDFVAKTELGAGFTLSFKAKNLLGAHAVTTQGDATQEDLPLGRSFGLGLKWAW